MANVWERAAHSVYRTMFSLYFDIVIKLFPTLFLRVGLMLDIL